MTNDVTITENRGVIYLHGSDGHKALIPRETVALRAYFTAERVPEDVQALVERAREYLRQRSRMLGLAPEIHTVHADPNAEPVTLDLAWLAAISDALEAAYSQWEPVEKGAE